jgi:hypothetical protein
VVQLKERNNVHLAVRNSRKGQLAVSAYCRLHVTVRQRRGRGRLAQLNEHAGGQRLLRERDERRHQVVTEGRSGGHRPHPDRVRAVCLNLDVLCSNRIMHHQTAVCSGSLEHCGYNRRNLQTIEHSRH